MKTLQLQQGSDAWLAHRRTVRNASDASVMMGAFPTFSRRELVKLCATGVDREFSQYVQDRILDRGHEVEPALRALAEEMIGEDLYPVTGVSDDGYLGASFDGVTLGEDIILEAKQRSEKKIEHLAHGDIPPQDRWQIVQQFAVCESAQRCLYLVGDGTEENSAYLWIERAQVEADIPKLIAGWQQFDADVAAYVPEAPEAPAAIGRAPETLPYLSVVATGVVEFSNMAEFRRQAMAVLGSINRNLQTDEDFANAEQTVRWCKGVEEKLDATKQQILGQMADVDTVMRAMDEVAAETRRIRLELDKLVSKEKENRRAEIVATGRKAYEAHVAALRVETKDVWLPLAAPDFALAIKGKKSLSSMKDAVDATLAHGKIAANEQAAHIRAALACLTEETAEHKHLFPDYLTFIAKPVEDIRALVRGRIAEHLQRETERLEQERERIRQEEAERIERERAAEEVERQKRDAATAAQARESVEPAKDASVTVATIDGTVNVPATTVTASPPRQNFAPAKRLKLGDINAAIAPLTITADGLAQLGFKPVASKGAAKLYAGSDFPAICQALADVIAEAPQQIGQQEAA